MILITIHFHGAQKCEGDIIFKEAHEHVMEDNLIVQLIAHSKTILTFYLIATKGVRVMLHLELSLKEKMTVRLWCIWEETKGATDGTVDSAYSGALDSMLGGAIKAILILTNFVKYT